ncbi:MAG: nucleotidyltransferase family protein [Chitinispirillaceae bacterium]|nr:nucleotidyltransferase family protein [Chitinispirillaceae bacterium]
MRVLKARTSTANDNYFSPMMSGLVRSAVYGEPLSPPALAALDDERLLDELEYQGIAALMYPAVSEEPSLSRRGMDRFRRAYENALIYKDLALQVLRDLREALTRTGRIALMQGIALYEHVYHEPLARCMSDIDLFLPDNNLAEVQAVLRKNGFLPYRSYKGVWTRKGVMIDLHCDLWGADRIPGRRLITKPFDLALEQSRLLPGYLVPSASCAALHAAFHGLKHGFARMVWLADVLMLLRAGHYNTMLERNDTFIVSIALRRLQSLGCIRRDDLAHQPVTLPFIRRILIDTLVRNGEREGYGECALALSCTSWHDTAGYFAGSLLPPRQTLEAMYGERSYLGLCARRFFSLVRKTVA